MMPAFRSTEQSNVPARGRFRLAATAVHIDTAQGSIPQKQIHHTARCRSTEPALTGSDCSAITHLGDQAGSVSEKHRLRSTSRPPNDDPPAYMAIDGGDAT